MFVDTSTTKDKYFSDKRENIPQPIDMQYFKKPISFRQIFTACLKFT